MTLLNSARAQFLRLFGKYFWIERPADLQNVRGLISTLQPKSTLAPLIRVGAKEDGGYLMPDDFEGIVACISPGVSAEISFDLSMAGRGIPVFMADASVNGPPVENDKFHFTKKFLDVFEDSNNTRIDRFIETVAPKTGDMVLQMDIEGAEWRVLLDMNPEHLKRFRHIVLEVHALDAMFSQSTFPMIEAVFKKLKANHDVVHIHPNNYSPLVTVSDVGVYPIMEFTFYRKDREFSEELSSQVFPHALDVENVPSNQPSKLPFIWYKQLGA